MVLFDKKYVYFLCEFDLKGKRGFFANDIGTLVNSVNGNFGVKDGLVKFHDAYFPFEDNNGSEWKFFYFDPNYEWKFLYKSGRKIQYREMSGSDWREVDDNHAWNEDYEYKLVLGEINKYEMLTHKQLAEWLARGNGQMYKGKAGFNYSQFIYQAIYDDCPVPVGHYVRKWGDTKWHNPTMDYCYPNENKEEA